MIRYDMYLFARAAQAATGAAAAACAPGLQSRELVHKLHQRVSHGGQRLPRLQSTVGHNHST